jgi:hypothetical protein
MTNSLRQRIAPLIGPQPPGQPGIALPSATSARTRVAPMTLARVAVCRAAAAVLAVSVQAVLAAPSQSFRIADIELRDPHVFIDSFGCHDVTDTLLGGFAINTRMQEAVTGDTDMDGYLDLSYVLDFQPLDQSAQDNLLRVGNAACTAPAASSRCLPVAAGADTIATLSDSSTCLATIAGTVRGYTPAITLPTAPCFASASGTFMIDLAGIPVVFTDAQVAATFDANPAHQLKNGLLRGFLPEADANATIVPDSYAVIGGKSLSALLRGGTGSCASGSDLDTNGDTAGWWFYFNFVADEVSAERIFADDFE